MGDRYLEFSHTGLGRQMAGLLGLPSPPRLKRAAGGYVSQPLSDCAVLLGANSRAQLVPALVEQLAATGAELQIAADHVGFTPIKQAASDLHASLKGEPGDTGVHAIVFDASGIDDVGGLRELYDFFQPRIRRLSANGRVVLVSRAPEAAGSARASATSHALRGFMRSLGKEVGRKGATANLIEMGEGAERGLGGPLRFLLTEHSAFVSGQILPLEVASKAPAPEDFVLPLRGKRALVTGAARGIGAAIAQTLAREGAMVIGMDRESEKEALQQTLAESGGQSLLLDVTDPKAAAQIARFAADGLDIVVHNAGVLRDKTLRNMPPKAWDAVLSINFDAIMRITEGLLAKGLNDGARVVCISSINGISGAPGQTNYAATKAGLIGYVDAMAQQFAWRGGAINAVAPGFIETQMTASMPMMLREAGRRLSSLSQGGLPIDVAEAVTFMASPLAVGLNGRTLRVCGQNFVGA